jgi:hypothetical protein
MTKSAFAIPSSGVSQTAATSIRQSAVTGARFERYSTPSLLSCDPDHSPSDFFLNGMSKISLPLDSVGSRGRLR